MKYYGLQMNRSLLKETGVPGIISVFSKEEDMLNWVKADRAHRRHMRQKEVLKWLGCRGYKWLRQYEKERLDQDIEVQDEMDELYKSRVNRTQNNFQPLSLFEQIKASNILKGY